MASSIQVANQVWETSRHDGSPQFPSFAFTTEAASVFSVPMEIEGVGFAGSLYPKLATCSSMLAVDVFNDTGRLGVSNPLQGSV